MQNPNFGKKFQKKDHGSDMDEDDMPMAKKSPGGGLKRKDSLYQGLKRKDGDKFSANKGENEHTGHGLKVRQPDCLSSGQGDVDFVNQVDVQDSAPPGREEQVKALKDKPSIDNPYAVAWAQYNEE
jgi:hypothetical protein